MDGGGNAVGEDEQGLVERQYGAIGMAKRGVVQSQLSLFFCFFLNDDIELPGCNENGRARSPVPIRWDSLHP